MTLKAIATLINVGLSLCLIVMVHDLGAPESGWCLLAILAMAVVNILYVWAFSGGAYDLVALWIKRKTLEERGKIDAMSNGNNAVSLDAIFENWSKDETAIGMECVDAARSGDRRRLVAAACKLPNHRWQELKSSMQ